MSQSLKILIADDSDLMRVIMKGFFKKYRPTSEISEAANLKDMFSLLTQIDFDFLLLDINMPAGDSNPDMVREIIASYKDLKICMFTGNEKTILENAYLEAGAIGFIQKDGNISGALKEMLDNHF